MPNENASGPKHARELADHTTVIRRIAKEAERCEQVQDGIELSGPFRGQTSHVAKLIAEPCTSSARAGASQQLRRQIQTIDVEASLGEQVRMAPLTAGHVENVRPIRQAENVEQPRHFLTVALECEQRFVFAKIGGVEIMRPPIAVRR